jgi:hypothetical protein
VAFNGTGSGDYKINMGSTLHTRFWTNGVVESVNGFEVVPVSSLVKFTNDLSGKSFYYVSKVRYNTDITKTEVVDKTKNLNYLKKELSVVYLKNEESKYDKLLFYIVYY